MLPFRGGRTPKGRMLFICLARYRERNDDRLSRFPLFPAGTHFPLLLIFLLRLFPRLPLHVRGMIPPARAQRLDVVHDVARTGAAGLAGGGRALWAATSASDREINAHSVVLVRPD